MMRWKRAFERRMKSRRNCFSRHPGADFIMGATLDVDGGANAVKDYA
jgi:hypothetical protein